MSKFAGRARDNGFSDFSDFDSGLCIQFDDTAVEEIMPYRQVAARSFPGGETNFGDLMRGGVNFEELITRF